MNQDIDRPDALPLTLADYRRAGAIIGDSFADDPVNSWVFGKESGIAAYFTLIAKKQYLVNGYGHGTGDLGATLWIRSEFHQALPLLQSLDIAASIIWNSGLGALIRGLKLDEGMADHHPKEPHHYLYAIGTRQKAQGKGLGGKLMTAGLERVDAERSAAYLESSKASNIPFYKRFGFELMGELIPTEGCPPMYPMWREPRSAIF